MAFSHTHVPLFFDQRFANSSVRNTLFADTTMELDHTVNRIWQAVKDAGIENNTLILATSDNGPWAVKCDLAGSAGPYVGAWQHTNGGGGSSLKDTTWEGGQRVFGFAHWPGHIPAGLVTGATASSLDYLPTILALAGVKLPADRSFDGVDLAPLLFGNATKVRDFLFMSDTIDGNGNVTSVRYKNFKAYTRTYNQPSCTEPKTKPIDHPDYLIFDLDADPGESTPVRPPQDVLDAIWTAHHALLVEVNATMRSNTSYAVGPTMVGSAPCCNAANAVCRCNANE
jgi:arylsulfatase G